MPANKLRIVLPYSNLGDGDWSDQMDRCREMEIERLEAEESAGDHPAEQQLQADEIAELLDSATGDYGKAYDDIAGEYVRYFGATVSSRLRLKLGLSFFAMHRSKDYFDESDAIYALAPLNVVHELFDRSHKERHHRFREQLGGTKKEFGALLAKPLDKWNEREIGALLSSLIDVDDVESEVFSDMAESSDCFYADSAIDWAAYNSAADEIRRRKRAARREPDFVSRIPRAIRSAPPPRDAEHPCAGLSDAEVAAFDALASGDNPIRAERALARLVKLGLILMVSPPFNVSECVGPTTRYHFSIPVQVHVKWCHWAMRRALDKGQVRAGPTGDGEPTQPSLFGDPQQCPGEVVCQHPTA